MPTTVEVSPRVISGFAMVTGALVTEKIICGVLERARQNQNAWNQRGDGWQVSRLTIQGGVSNEYCFGPPFQQTTGLQLAEGGQPLNDYIVLRHNGQLKVAKIVDSMQVKEGKDGFYTLLDQAVLPSEPNKVTQFMLKHPWMIRASAGVSSAIFSWALFRFTASKNIRA